MPQCFGVPPTAGGPGGGGRRRHRILAYGDSLTAGYHGGGDGFSPYGAALVEALAPEIEAEVWVCGLSGLMALDMVQKLDAGQIRDCVGRTGKGIQQILAEHGPFDIVLIMAGTNDLATRVCPAVVAASVQALHSACHEQKLRTVAISVPPNDLTGGDSGPPSRQRLAYVERWARTNRLLRQWAQGPGVEQGVAVFVDAETIVPYSEESDCWEEDGLHLSQTGSKRLGEGLAPLVAPLLAGGGVALPRPFSTRHTVPMPECFLPPGSATDGVRRCLAFGDSLTAGYYAFGHLFAPYAESLVQALSPHVMAQVWMCGFSGMMAAAMAEDLDAAVLTDVVMREGKGLRRILEDHGPFDMALIMAGTNDLADDAEPAAIASSVLALHRACHEFGVPTVLLAVPPSQASEREAGPRRRRRAVNCLLQDWAAAHASAPGQRAGVAACVDTGELLPFDPESGDWEVDGLHFSRAGSARLGTRLAGLLRPLLADAGAAAAERLA